MEKRTLLAVVVSIAVLIVWQWFFMPNSKRQSAPAPESLATGINSVPSARLQMPSSPGQPAAASQEKESKKITVETNNAVYELSENEASIIQCSVKETMGKKKSLVNLVLNDGRLLNDADSGQWEYVPQNGNPYSVKFVNAAGKFDIEKTFEFDKDSYFVGVKYSIANGGAAADYRGVELSIGPGLGTDAKEMKENKRLTRVISYKEKKVDRLKVGTYPFDGKWAGVDNRYFLSVIFGQDDVFKSIIVTTDTNKASSVGFVTGAVPFAGGEKKEFRVTSYIGPKGYDHLCLIRPGGKDCELQKAVDFGFFSDLGKVALVCLNYFYKITHNYGWSIVIISLILNIITFPLSKKSFKSAQAMKSIQGDVKFIQTKYKSDPQKMNTEIWNLYKSKGVNPFSGCLPMLIQLPIFWALFTMLRNAYELRGAGWMFWINDLSKPDVLFTVSNFNVPLLPIIMGGGMFVQQWMTAPSSDPTQKQMMYMMPIIFTVMFFGFPSGLVIYWLTNSVVTIATQWVMLKKLQAD